MPAPPSLPLVRLPPPPEFLSPTGSAFVAPGAPPSPFRPAWGFPRRADSRDVSSERPSRGVRLPFRVLRVFAARSPAPPRPPKRPECFVSAGSASQASCSHERVYAGCPLSSRKAETSRDGRKLAELPPVPSSGFLPLSTVLAALRDRRVPCETRPSRRPDASRPCSMPLASLESPFRAFPLPRSRARFREPLLPCGFAFDRCLARRAREFRDRFPHRVDPLPRLALSGSPDAWAVTAVPRDR